MSSAAAIIPAAGSGRRMGLDHPKQFHLLAGVPVLVHTVQAFVDSPCISRVVVVVPADHLDSTHEMLQEHGFDMSRVLVTAGGKRRQDSVFNGLNVLGGGVDIVLVHDGARPLVTTALIARCCRAAEESGAAIAAVPVKDTLKKSGQGNCIAHTVDREDLWQAQTPQAARLSLLLRAYREAEGRDVTDEASLLEGAGIPVQLVEGAETNIKITRPDDLVIAEKIMQGSMQTVMRVGHGYDAHQFASGRDLVLGGVKVPFEHGLAGHSDADVLTHALCDALLGAVGKGDIGSHFPDSDRRFKDIYSINLLKDVVQIVEQKNLRLSNADITVICQKPKLSPFIPEMREILAAACTVSKAHVNIKATTTEKMGFTGRMEGISCHAVVLLTGKEGERE